MTYATAWTCANTASGTDCTITATSTDMSTPFGLAVIIALLAMVLTAFLFNMFSRRKV